MRHKRALVLVTAMACCCALPARAGNAKEPVAVPEEAVSYADVYADQYRVPRALVHAIIRQESHWNPRAHSNKGAQGIMQLMPATCKRFRVADPYSVSENIRGGVRLLADLMQQFGDLRLVAAAYYAGTHRLELRGLKYSNPDVTDYVRSIRRLYDEENATNIDLAPRDLR